MELSINKLNFDFELELKDMFYKNYPIKYSSEESTKEKLFLKMMKSKQRQVLSFYGAKIPCVSHLT